MRVLKVYLFLLVTFCSSLVLHAYTLPTGDSVRPFGSNELSRYIAEQMLAHEEEINLASRVTTDMTTDYINAAIDEAYKQNPLIDCICSIRYNATDKIINIDYLNSKEMAIRNMSLVYSRACNIRDSLGILQRSDLDKVLMINNYIIGNMTYDRSIQDSLAVSDYTLDKEYLKKHGNSFTPYGSLIEGKGVCEAYAEGFHTLAKVSGLNCIIVTGSSDGLLHEWCKVEINNKWYNVDPTKNDDDVIVNAYLNLSDKEFTTVAVSDNTSILPEYAYLYAAVNNDLEYYKLMGKTALTSQEAINKLTKFFRNKPVNATITLRFYNNLDKRQVDSIMEAVCGSLGIIKYRCTFKGKFMIVTPMAYMRG